MNCNDFSRYFADYTAGELSEDDKNKLDEHLQKCSGCRGSLRIYDVMAEAARASITPCPHDLVSTAIEEARSQMNARRGSSWQGIAALLRRPLVLAPVTAAIVLLIALVACHRPVPRGVDHSVYSRERTAGPSDRSSIAVMAVPIDSGAVRAEDVNELGEKVARTVRDSSVFGGVRSFPVSRKAREALLTIYKKNLKQGKQVDERRLDPVVQEEFWSQDAVIIVYIDGKHGGLVSIAAVKQTGRIKLFARSADLAHSSEGNRWTQDVISWLGRY